MSFTIYQFASAYILDLIIGDPPWMPHPIRWIGRMITWFEDAFYDVKAGPVRQRAAGFAFWTSVVLVVTVISCVGLGVSFQLHPLLGNAVAVWLGFSTLATCSLRIESAKVARALEQGKIEVARERLALIVSRDTSQLNERDIVRALIETVSENISDGIIAPLFYLALGGPVLALVYKAVNTMDSMVGYFNDRYRYFGWFAARADDVANWIPARLSGFALVMASACVRMDWRKSWDVMLRDAGKMKSPNAGYPEAAAAGALGVMLGGTSFYFGKPVDKPTLGDSNQPLTLATYRRLLCLMYATSVLFFAFACIIRAVVGSV